MQFRSSQLILIFSRLLPFCKSGVVVVVVVVIVNVVVVVVRNMHVCVPLIGLGLPVVAHLPSHFFDFDHMTHASLLSRRNVSGG